MHDPKLFATRFPGETWQAWTAFLAALFGLPLTDDQLDVYRACTGRSAPPEGGFDEAFVVAGRRSGKSSILAMIAVFLAAFEDWRQRLAPGERGVVMIVAADRKQARVIFRYAEALVDGVPMLANMVTRRTSESLDFNTGSTIEIVTANFRNLRGYTVVAALLDELAFFRSDESANPDREIIAALRPAMSTIAGAKMIAASSPYSRRGVLWTQFRDHFAVEEAPTLVWQAATRTMNPLVKQRVIDDALASDPASAASEYMAEFRSDVGAFLDRELIEAATRAAPLELPPQAEYRYSAFTDSSGGRHDRDLRPKAPAFIRRVLFLHSALLMGWHARRAWSPQVAQARGAHLRACLLSGPSVA